MNNEEKIRELVKIILELLKEIEKEYPRYSECIKESVKSITRS